MYSLCLSQVASSYSTPFVETVFLLTWTSASIKPYSLRVIAFPIVVQCEVFRRHRSIHGTEQGSGICNCNQASGFYEVRLSSVVSNNDGKAMEYLLCRVFLNEPLENLSAILGQSGFPQVSYLKPPLMQFAFASNVSILCLISPSMGCSSPQNEHFFIPQATPVTSK